jgi:ATP-dependent helicase/nuclease subunit A
MSSSPSELTPTIVRAGAGAGKTRGLVEQVVAIYRQFREQRQTTPRIVLTTFTRKATQELKERLTLRACRERDAELLQFMTDPSKLHIATIHGLLNVFLQQVGHLAGMDSGFRIVGEAEGLHLGRLALRELLVENAENLPWLEIYGFDRILAMCRLYSQALREQGELRAAELADLQAVTDRYLHECRGQLADLAVQLEKLTNEGKWLTYVAELRQFVETWSTPSLEGLPTRPRRNNKQPELEDLHLLVEGVIGRVKKDLERNCWRQSLWPDLQQEWTRFAPLAQQFAAKLEALKEQMSSYEMIDLELKSLEILRSKPFLGAIFAENWDYWMIDEYQDTSPLQVTVMQALIGEQPKYLVGDPQQSIYLFRGAEVAVFAQAEEEIGAAGGQRIQLSKNYRSEPDLLNWINDFMASIGPNFVRMEPRGPLGEVRSCVTLYRAPDEQKEIQGLVARIEQLLTGGARLEEICVLSRTHRGLLDISRVLKDYGYPTHVHAARGFGQRREVIDAAALWKFLVNPHDNLNLMILLRSPWFFVSDEQLTEFMRQRPTSLWTSLLAKSDLPEALERLKHCRQEVSKWGLVCSFERALSANALLDLSLQNDPAGRKESNLWKLIARARQLEREGGQSLLNLMDDGLNDPLNTEDGDATSAQEPNCINLMTIHGSKGLEFDHILLPRMHESPRTSSTEVFGAKNQLFHFPVWLESEAEFVASPLDFAQTRAKRQKELEEYDRWLYVALTRAKRTLTLSWTEPQRDSWAARSTWFTQRAGEYQRESYRYQMLEELPDPQPYSSSINVSAEVLPPFRQNIEASAPDRHSVTELVEAEKPALRQANLLQRWQAQALGTRLHRLFEGLKYQREPQIGEQDREAVDYLLQLQDPPLRELLQHGEVEWGFQIQTAKQMIEGQIDLWAKHDGRLYVVDYKSGSPKAVEEAFQQLSLYAWALRRFGHEEPIEMVVIYPLKQKLERRAFDQQLFASWEVKLS